ncbi:hypothetical protein APHAL10511_006994 [Amanita phalloides]|nr:hypothetical protein APHAL10511_006994 [Amanita phalloides]
MSASCQSLEDITTVLRALRTRVHDVHDLLALLAAPLKSIGFLPAIYDNDCLGHLCSPIGVRDHIPLIQHALIEDVAPSWEIILREKGNIQLLEQYFCPTGEFKDESVVIDIVPLAYSTILSMPLTSFSVHLLQLLSSKYPMDKVYMIIFNRGSSVKQELLWEDYVRNLLSIASRVANDYGVEGKQPPSLERAIYFKNICVQCEQLIAYTSGLDINERSIAALVYLLTKLVGQGVFPSTPPVARSQVSFFEATMASIRLQLEGQNRESYSETWTEIIESIPSRLTLQSFVQSIFAALQVFIADDRFQTHVSAQILRSIIGIPLPNKIVLWECVMAVLIDKEWQEGLVEGILYWISGTLYGEKEVKIEALQAFLDVVMDVWMSPDHINYTFVSRHRYITTLSLAIISYLPPSSECVNYLISSPSFIAAVGCYISHMDESVRLCGMLVAEVLSSMTGKVLIFDVWNGEDETRSWARHVRDLFKERGAMASVQKDAEPPLDQEKQTSRPIQEFPNDSGPDDGCDSDDSLTGYTPFGSSRSPSPVLTDLAEIEKEPTMNVGVKRVSKPIYLSQLSNLLQSQNDRWENDQPSAADKVETALNNAQGLIRRKKYVGSELEENAVQLVLAFLGLQKNYELPQFDIKRQGVLNALIASCPHLAAPCIIEEFYKPQYSMVQRFVALEALVSGARELTASQPFNHQSKISHPGDQCSSSLNHSPMHSSKRDATHASNSELFLYTLPGKGLSNETQDSLRTKCLRVPMAKSPSAALSTPRPSHTPFIVLSTPYFISPLITRFWLFLRDEQSREQRTMLHQGRSRHHSAGSAMILNPVVLVQLLRTLAILVHLSRLSSEWLAVVAPESLEIALTVGTLPVSRVELESGHDDYSAFATASNWEQQDAAILTAAFELAVLVLDGCLELDRGRFLSLQRTTLLQRTGDWGRNVFSRLNQGLKVRGGGGVHETSLMRAVTGVLLKVDDIIAYWRQSMVALPFS